MNGGHRDDPAFDRALGDGLAAAAGRRPEGCPAPELFLAAAQGELAPAEAERLARHAEGCPLCAAERDLAGAWAAAPEAGVDAADLAAVVARLAPPADGRVVTFPSPLAVPSRTPQPLRSAAWRRWAGVGALAAAAGLAAVAVRTGFGPGSPGSPLPDPPAIEVQRSGVVEGLDPAGEQPGAPGRLSWTPVEGAVRYSVAVLAVDDEVLWRAEVAAPAASLPESLGSGLQPGVVYRWRVEALAADGRVVATSETAAFRLAPPAETPDGAPFIPLSSGR